MPWFVSRVSPVDQYYTLKILIEAIWQFSVCARSSNKIIAYSSIGSQCFFFCRVCVRTCVRLQSSCENQNRAKSSPASGFAFPTVSAAFNATGRSKSSSSVRGCLHDSPQGCNVSPRICDMGPRRIGPAPKCPGGNPETTSGVKRVTCIRLTSCNAEDYPQHVPQPKPVPDRTHRLVFQC